MPQWKYDVVNLFQKNIDQDVTEVNSDCGHEHKEWKYRLAVENEAVQKGESSVIPKMMYWEIQLWEGNSRWTALYALNEKCLSQVWLKEKKNK